MLIGATWDPAVIHTTFEPGAIGDFMFISTSAIEVDLGAPGTVLCGTPFIIILFDVPPSGGFLVPIPNNCVVVGATLCTQVGSTSVRDGSSFSLTNALDITIGSL